MLNFGDTGIDRPIVWEMLKKDYADKYKKGDRTPNLILKGDLLHGFVHTVGTESASLTNIVKYADDVGQLGARYKNLPPRPFYPVEESGELTEMAQRRQDEIVKSHFKESP